MSAAGGPDLVTNGLVLHLDAASRRSYNGGTIWRNLAGSNNGTLTNGPTFSSANGGSIVFDGVDDFAVVNSVNFNSNIITTSIWFNWSTYSNNDNLLLELSVNGNNNQNTFLIDPNSSAPTNNVFQFTIFGNGAGNYYGSYISRPPQSTWQHISVIWDNSTNNGNVTCYLNGVLQTTTTNRTTKNTSGNFKTDNLYLMSRAGNSLIAAGRLSLFQIYNRALSPAEVLQNYNATRSRFGV